MGGFDTLNCPFCSKMFEKIFGSYHIKGMLADFPDGERKLKEHLHDLHLKAIKFEVYRQASREMLSKSD